MKIVNSKKLSTTAMRIAALQIAEAGLSAIDSRNIIKEVLSYGENLVKVRDKEFVLKKGSKLLVIGVGKCAIEAAQAAEEILGDSITGGLVLDTRENNICEFKKIECFKGTHPMPSDKNVAATKRIMEILKGLSPEDLVIFLISGGGSTLLCLPEEGGQCVDEQLILSQLFIAGASIQEINTVRKHISLARGGHLAQAAYPARIISLIFSDVPSNDMSVIASGPTVMDKSTIADAEVVLKKYDVLTKCGLEHCGLIETPKEAKYFKDAYNTVVISNDRALAVMSEEAEKLGYHPEIKESSMTGEARNVGQHIAEKLRETPPGSALLYGGETTVVITNTDGKGGRNQELCLSALLFLPHKDSLIMALASDGRDNGPYAGAIADGETLMKAESEGLKPEEFLDSNNSSVFFEKTEDYLIMDSTGSNVSDLVVALSKPK
ncbi:MAG: hypothetical protein A2665_02880 [Candidatus Zambryskibacteria bacterium RIFCSPHIGHO2_01_FULL_46_30]|uniref:Glycerate kinase n=1 Tax=Candidatus Zambryskibacteria bacterium RIFCSPHIGHO2_01_FULL_46_30 TaxID=1802739 RepID=A0A1G2T1H8_9BACT|nr:MAG: hypothetical protein A2665_02880 [Candidatus Zambryskibacteria bacterium RIFCSPHIGHO2_01_FULL_46_30]OHB06059.1 MAG: hypothetical protein A3B22_01800 [Candidatus Zambryskibacteria bacterium RIFCSPLOWO2_01_FULL_47_33]